MAHSRLEKIGTIYSRVTGLIRAGAMRLEDRPIWYEVYEAFPPKLPPTFDRKMQDSQIRQIFYPEDTIRALFYKKMSNISIGNLSDTRQQTLCQKCIALSEKIAQEESIPLEKAFESAFTKIFGEMTEVKKEPQKQLSVHLDLPQEESVDTKQKDVAQKILTSVKDIFKQ